MSTSTDTGWRPTKGTVSVFLYLSAAGLLAAGLVALSGGKLSLSRLALFGAALLLAGGLCFLSWQLLANQKLINSWQPRANNQAQNSLIIITALLGLAGWLLVWTPLESFGGLFYYAQAAYPFVIWLTGASLASLALLLAARFGIQSRAWQEILRDQRPVLLVALSSLLVFGMLAWVASRRILHITPADEDFWYGAGAPILAFQVLGALLVGLALALLVHILLRRVPTRSKQIDLLVFIAIWAISAWLWASQPVRTDFLVTKPVAPNYQMYPDYDARNYDLMSQFALLGQGINNHSFFDRVLYPAFLVYLHNLAGQDYPQVMALQAAIFAILPALLYLIGKYIHSRAAGLVLSMLVALRGITHIDVGNLIETAHQKHMLTEYPTAVLLVLATFLLVKWASAPSRHWPLAGLAGMVISLSTLLRPHPLALLPLIPALAILLYRQRARLWIGLSALVFSAALLSLVPWLQFGGQNVSIVTLYMTRIKTIIEQRYPQLIQPQGSLPAISTPHLAAPRPAPLPEKSVLAFAADNYLNNLVTSIQVLPTTPFNLDARVVVKKTENFWKPYWDGSLTPWARLLVPLNLLLVALGLGAAWKRARLGGLIPLLIMLVYFAVNAFARTSGGRYLVPVDWVVALYYALGLVTIAEFCLALFGRTIPTVAQDQPAAQPAPLWRPVASVLVLSVCLGALIPLAQVINPLRFQPLEKTELVSRLLSVAGSNLGLSDQELQRFLTTENAVILQGRSLYPRQFNKDEGLDISIYSFYHSLPYPRTIFTLIGQNGEKVIILPRTDPAPVAHASDFLVLGCQAADNVIQAWAVLDLANNNLTPRLPAAPVPLTCPLPEPVCDNNKNCH